MPSTNHIDTDILTQNRITGIIQLQKVCYNYNTLKREGRLIIVDSI